MSGFAGQLSAKDIRELSRYYSAQRPGLDTSKRPARR
jgi:cytochrome c553